MLSLGMDSLMFERECEECESDVFMIQVKVFYGFNWYVVKMWGLWRKVCCVGIGQKCLC